MRPARELSDAELAAEIVELARLDDEAALSSPAALLEHLTAGRAAGRYRRRPHLDVIADSITGLAETYADPGTLLGPRLIVEVPPQTGKTLTAVVGTAFWWLCNHPTHRVIIGSYSEGLANDRGRDVRNLVRDYGSRYGLVLERGSASVKDWRLASGGGVKSVGVGTGATGSPGDLVIIDDPHKSRAEAESLIIRDRVYGWYSAEMISRLSPKAAVIIVMTPWHEDDLAARVVDVEGRTSDGGRWDVIRMPAYCDDPARDPLGRASGEPLPHPKIDVGDTAMLRAHWESRRAASTVRDWSSLYMCDPKPVTGALVSLATLRERRCYQTSSPCHPCDQQPTRVGVGVDPGGGGRDTVGIVSGYLGSDKRLYFTHDRSETTSTDVWPRTVCHLAREVGADIIVFEANFGGTMALSLIRTAWAAIRGETLSALDAAVKAAASDSERSALNRERRDFERVPCPRVKSVSARRSKVLRAEPIAQLIVEDRIRLGAYLPEFEHEWATWQPGQPDSPGRIDAGVHLATELVPLSPVTTGSTRQQPGALPMRQLTPLSRKQTGPGRLNPFGR